MKNLNYVIHTKQGTQVLKFNDFLNNAREQQKAGISPAYCYNYSDGVYGRAGYLVYSTATDGVGVFVPLIDDGFIYGGYIMCGQQGDFVFDIKAATT